MNQSFQLSHISATGPISRTRPPLILVIQLVACVRVAQQLALLSSLPLSSKLFKKIQTTNTVCKKSTVDKHTNTRNIPKQTIIVLLKQVAQPPLKKKPPPSKVLDSSSNTYLTLHRHLPDWTRCLRNARCLRNIMLLLLLNDPTNT
jgi:hypothetical protein